MVSQPANPSYAIEAEAKSRALGSVLETYLSPAPVSAAPTITLIIGPPGSGKSTNSKQASNELTRTGKPVVIDLDELRQFHPFFNRIIAEQGIKSPNFTHPFASEAREALLSQALEKRANIIFESTGNDLESIKTVADRAKSRGYEVNLRLIATNQDIIPASVFDRYERGLETGNPRMVPMSYTLQNVKNLPGVIDKLSTVSSIDHLSVNKRDGTVLFSEKGTEHASEAARVLEGEMSKPLPPLQQLKIGQIYSVRINSLPHDIGDNDLNRPLDYRLSLSTQYEEVRSRYPAIDVTHSKQTGLLSVSVSKPETNGPHAAATPMAGQNVVPVPADGEGSFSLAKGTSFPFNPSVVHGGLSAGSAVLSGWATYQRIKSGQLDHDLKGNAVEASAGVTAVATDAANASGGLVMAAAHFLPAASQSLEGVSRFAGKAAMPLAAASTGAEIVAGLAENNPDRSLRAGARFGGMVAGAHVASAATSAISVLRGITMGAGAAGAAGAETGPFDVIIAAAGGIAGGYLGDKGMQMLLDKMHRAKDTHDPEQALKLALLPLSQTANAMFHDPAVIGRVDQTTGKAIYGFHKIDGQSTEQAMAEGITFAHEIASQLRSNSPSGDVVRKALDAQLVTSGVTAHQYADYLEQYAKVFEPIKQYLGSGQSLKSCVTQEEYDKLERSLSAALNMPDEQPPETLSNQPLPTASSSRRSMPPMRHMAPAIDTAQHSPASSKSAALSAAAHVSP